MNEIVSNILGSEPIISLAVTLAGTAIAMLCGTLRSKVKKDGELDELLHFVETGVNETYETFVREIKSTANGGKLTKAQRLEARSKARAYAIEKAEVEGVDLVKRMGSAALSNWIKRLVDEKKAAFDPEKALLTSRARFSGEI